MIDPVAFSVFGFGVRWYGIVYVVGFVFAYFFLMHFAREFGFDWEELEKIFLFVMIFGILGGRLFYVLFYNPAFYLANPVEVFSVWRGGMSIHGGFLGAFFVLWFFARRSGLSLLRLADFFCLPAGFALALGRLANFVNQELVGKVTSWAGGVVFPMIDDKVRWPVQIFESLKNMVVFEVLLFLHFFRKLRTGVLSGLFLVLYNFGRFFVDFLREPTIDLGWISLGQFFCLVYGFLGVWILVRVFRSNL